MQFDSAPKSVVIFGETLIDVFDDKHIVGGAPFNVARNLATFGVAPLMISRVGQDSAAQLIIDDMQHFGMSQIGLQTDVARPTGLVQVKQTATGHTFEIVAKQAYDFIDAAAAQVAIDTHFHAHAPHIFYFGTLALREPAARHSLFELVNNTPATIYLDLNLRAGQFELETINNVLKLADILKVNDEELAYLITHFFPHDSDFASAICNGTASAVDTQTILQKVITQFNLRAVIVTLGARGFAYFDATHGLISGTTTPLSKEQIVDTVGCGDAFSAVFLAGLCADWPIQTTLQRAAEFASAVCTIQGAVSPDPAFYQQWQHNWKLSHA